MLVNHDIDVYTLTVQRVMLITCNGPLFIAFLREVLCGKEIEACKFIERLLSLKNEKLKKNERKRKFKDSRRLRRWCSTKSFNVREENI